MTEPRRNLPGLKPNSQPLRDSSPAPKQSPKNRGRIISGATNENMKLLFHCIQLRGKAKPGDLAKELHWTRSTLAYNLKKLQGQKRIERMGSGQGVRYQVLSKSGEKTPVPTPGKTIENPPLNLEIVSNEPVVSDPRESNPSNGLTWRSSHDATKSRENQRGKSKIRPIVISLELLVLILWWVYQFLKYRP